MALVPPQDDPRISDIVSFSLTTTDSDGALVNPYKVNQVIIYFIERGHTVENDKSLTVDIDGELSTSYFKDAVPVTILGSDTVPAWLSTDTDNAFIEKVDFDDDGNPLIGTFRYEWSPKVNLAKEGDYVICWKWTIYAAGDTLADMLSFILRGNTHETTSIPTHFTPAEKYETLLDRYQPQMFSMMLGNSDVTPSVLHRTNKAIAKGFTSLEDLANQIVDLIDANVVADALLPYLSNLFDWRLKSADTVLWRRQIKQAVPLYKRKGTKPGLTEALAECGMELLDFSQLWQVVSSTTWQEAFVITDAEQLVYDLVKTAIVEDPIDTNNFAIYLRLADTDEYIQLSLDYVIFATVLGSSTVTWNGDNLSINPISLQAGDVLRVIYKIAQPVDQELEDYIRTLPLADRRDELTVTYPKKNWNVRLIAENDVYFSAICPERNPFYDPVIYGKIRTEFPFSENIYNMDEYNGSTRDSTNPCDLDKNFLDACSCCVSSYFNITLEIVDLDPERLSEAEDVIKDFVPFHAIPYNIYYIGVWDEYVLTPQEQIEVFALVKHNDNVIITQVDFNRLIPEGDDYSDTFKRNMLATGNVVTSTSGTGYNSAVTLFSPGLQFDTMGIDDDVLGDNLLEILSGVNAGEYQVVVNNERFVVDIIQGAPDTIASPFSTAGFPFRLSNVVYEEASASVYQDDIFTFSDDVAFANLGTQIGWQVVVTQGIYVGTYPVVGINVDNTIVISGWPTTSNVSGLVYELQTGSSVVVATSTTGVVTVTRQGRVEIELVAEELGIKQAYYVSLAGTQYLISSVSRSVKDNLYIVGYTGGDVVGSANITVLYRLVSATGYVGVRGMELVGTIPTVSYALEDDMFLENYLILIGTSYYKISSIDGSTMFLSGPMLQWGLTGTAVNYSIVQFIKTSPVETLDGVVFDVLDRRGNESIKLTTETASMFSMPMHMRAHLLNEINQSGLGDMVMQQEQITVDIEYR